VSIILPRERGGGHCDLVSALVLALWQVADVEVPEPPPVVGTARYWEAEQERMIRHMEQKLERKQNAEWW
jgi:hypothetical protein